MIDQILSRHPSVIVFMRMGSMDGKPENIMPAASGCLQHSGIKNRMDEKWKCVHKFSVAPG